MRVLADVHAGWPQACVRLHQGVSETDLTEDLQKFHVPTLIVHGDDNLIVPIGASAMLSSKLVPHAQFKIYPGAPHGLSMTHKDEPNADLLAFLKS